MDESLASKILAKIGIAILVVALVDLAYLNWWILKNQRLNSPPSTNAQNSTDQRAIRTDLIVDKEGLASPTPSPTTNQPEVPKLSSETKTIIEKETKTIVQTAQKEIFIPLGSASTKSNTYTELSGLEVTIDPAKYSEIESIVFEASLWVEGGNGRAWAQLYVVDDKNPLIESQITNPLGVSSLKTSGKIPIPTEQKMYRVQAKTDLVEFAAHVDNARLKITLK